MSSRALHDSVIVLDIIYCIWFIFIDFVVFLGTLLSGMDHSSELIEHERRNKTSLIVYSVGVGGTIIGFILLFFPNAYYCYQMVFKIVLLVMFIVSFLLRKNKNNLEKLELAQIWIERIYSINVVLSIFEFAYRE